MLDIIGIVLMLLVIAFIIAVVFIVMEINDLKRKVDGFYSPYNDMFSKVNGLYKGDKHGTERPKVDILDDDIFRDISSMETDIYDLQEKVEKLEKRKQSTLQVKNMG